MALQNNDPDAGADQIETMAIDHQQPAVYSSDNKPETHRLKQVMKKAILPVVILAGGVLTVVLLSSFQQPAGKKAAEPSSLGVNTLAVSPETVTFKVSSQGTIAPRTETTLVTEVSGVVMEVSPKLKAGGFFQKGEIMLSLDDGDYAVTVKQAKASLSGKRAQLAEEEAKTAQAEREWRLSGRSKEDAPLLVLRQPFLDKARAEVQFAEAELVRARRKLARTVIRAPYDGLVKQKHIGVGQYVTVGTLLADIVAVDYAEVRLPLTDEDMAYLDLPSPRDQQAANGNDPVMGPDVRVSANIGGTDYSWNGKIIRTEGIIDARSRVHYAVARIADPYGLHRDNSRGPPLSIGTFVKASIEGISAHNVLAIPRDAMRNSNTVLLMDSDSKLRLKQATVIRAEGNRVFVDASAVNGEEVVISPIALPVDGMQLHKVDTHDRQLGFRE